MNSAHRGGPPLPAAWILGVLLAGAGCGSLVDAGTFENADLTAAEIGDALPDASGDSDGGDPWMPDDLAVAGDGEADAADDLGNMDGDAQQDLGTGESLEDLLDQEGAEVCTPECGGKECGPDGCGGLCGVCSGPPSCGDVTFSSSVQKVNHLEPGTGGAPGEALDVDGNPQTCSPSPGCVGGLDNQLAGLLSGLSDILGGAGPIAFDTVLESGSLVLLLELVDPKLDGTPFSVNLYWGSTVEPKASCDFQVSECTYTVQADSVDPTTCVPLTSLTNATIEDGVLVAGGGPFSFDFVLTLSPGVEVTIPVSLLQLRGDVVTEGGKIRIENGILGGAVMEDILLDALAELTAELFSGLPFPPEVLTSLLKDLLVPDVDLDGDGSSDAASIGLKFGTIPGQIVGIDGGGAQSCGPDGQCM